MRRGRAYRRDRREVHDISTFSAGFAVKRKRSGEKCERFAFTAPGLTAHWPADIIVGGVAANG